MSVENQLFLESDRYTILIHVCLIILSYNLATKHVCVDNKRIFSEKLLNHYLQRICINIDFSGINSSLKTFVYFCTQIILSISLYEYNNNNNFYSITWT